MKKILLISTLLISLSSISYSDNHYPITRDSQLMIARGKIAYQNNFAIQFATPGRRICRLWLSACLGECGFHMGTCTFHVGHRACLIGRVRPGRRAMRLGGREPRIVDFLSVFVFISISIGDLHSRIVRPYLHRAPIYRYLSICCHFIILLPSSNPPPRHSASRGGLRLHR